MAVQWQVQYKINVCTLLIGKAKGKITFGKHGYE